MYEKNLDLLLLKTRIKNLGLLEITKISLIIIVGFFLIGFFNPFYEYPNNAKIYGHQALIMSELEYEYKNPWLEKTGFWEFVPAAMVKTQFNTGIPNILPFYPAIGAFFYKLFGLPGLFYLNPMITVLFLVISERITSKFCGRKISFFVLIFLATNEMTFWVGSSLLTSMLFSVFFMLGIYFLLKFLKIEKSSNVLWMSIFFTLAAFIRPNGVIFLPIALGVIVSYFIIKKYIDGKSIDIKKIGKNVGVSIGPWLIFIVFMFGFNQHFFGDPMITFYNVPDLPQNLLSDDKNAYDVNFERFERYAGHFLPFPIDRVAASVNYGETSANSNFDNLIESLKEIPFISHIGLSVFAIIGLSLFFSFKNKKLRKETLVFVIFIISLMLFYSLNYIAIGRQGAARDMMPVFPLFYALIGGLIVNILGKTTIDLTIKKTRYVKIGKILLTIFLIVFIPTSFYFADYSQIIKKEGFAFKDPRVITQNFPTIDDEISKNDIIVTIFEFDMVVRHGATIFTPYQHSNENHPLYIQMISRLNEILEDENSNVLVFKNPHDPREKKFHQNLSNSGNYIMTEYSEQFCKLELNKDKQKITDLGCIEND